MAFIGQATASTIMSYHMMDMSGMNGQEQSRDMSMMDHSNHNMISDSSDNLDESTDDCCTETCDCFAGGCSNVVAFMKVAGNVPIVDLSSKIFSYSGLALSQQTTSLFRPPIIT